MKKYKNIIAIVFVVILFIFACGIYLVNYQGELLYFLIVSGENSMGYMEARQYSGLSTEALLKIIDTNKNSNMFSPSHFQSRVRGGRYIGAIIVLGSKTDQEALEKLTTILNNGSVGEKLEVIFSIGKNKNKAMIPALCKALKNHSLWHTDNLIVDALVNIDDPSALQCFVEEKNKIESVDAQKKVAKAIEKWSKK